MRRVELDVRRAQADELVDLLPQDLGDVAEELLQVRVRGSRALGIPEVREQARAGERHLQHPVGATACVRELLGREEPPSPELPLDGQRRPLDLLSPTLVALPVAPEKRVEIPLAEALDRLGHLALERQTPHLAVRHDIETRIRLESESVVDGCVLDLLELGRAQLAARELLARGEQPWRSEEAANDV